MTFSKISTLKNDLPASIVVFFVALPLCLGIALASNAPLFSGIISGIIGGIIVGSISNSSLGVSGPAAGLTAIVFTAILSLGSYENFLLAVVIAGFLQLILGLLKSGVITYYFPTSVIKGMLSGIGVIIILKQIPHFLGWKSRSQGVWSFDLLDGQTTFTEILNSFNQVTLGSLLIGVLSLSIILIWDNILSKKHNLFKVIQGPFVAVLLGVICVIVFGQDSIFGLKSNQLVDVPIITGFEDLGSVFLYPNYSLIWKKEIWIIAFTLALVASLETLLSVEATDKLDPNKRLTNPNLELIAQGTGNIFSGMLGGLPITQVIVRSSANVQSGGQTKKSTIIHGFLIFIAVILIPEILNKIPLSVLASVLFIVGYKLAKPKLFIDIYNLGLAQFIPFVVTFVVIVMKDLLWGIAVGFLVSIFFVMYKSYKNSISLKKNISKLDEGIVRITFPAELSFLNKANLQKELNSFKDVSILEIDIRNNKGIDFDIMEILEDFLVIAKDNNIDIQLLTKKGEISNPESFSSYLEMNRRKYEKI